MLAKEKATFGFGRNVLVAGFVSFFMDVSSEMIYPLVPLFLANVLGVNKSLIGLIEGIAEATASILKVFSGWLSDRLGRRKILMTLGYGISGLSRPIMATAAGWQQIFASRFVDRLGKGIRTAPRDVIIVESTPKTHLARAFSFHRSMDVMGAVVGPALALLFLHVFSGDYRRVFWVSLIPACVAVCLIIFFIQEKGGGGPQAEIPKLTLSRFDWKVGFFIIIATLFSLGNSSNVFLVLKAQQVGVSELTIPALYLTFNLVYSLSAIPAGMAADRFGKKRLILLGFVLFAGLYYGFAVARNPNTVWLLFGLYGVFMGLTEGIQKAFLATIIPPDFKATAFGLYATSVGMAMLPASFVGGWLWDHFSSSATFYFGAAMASLSGLLFIVFILMTKTSRKSAF